MAKREIEGSTYQIPNEARWYVVRSISGQEKNAKTYLEKEVEIQGLQDSIIQVMTPTEKVYQIRKLKDGKTKKVAVERNFFPGYMLVEANLTNGEAIHTIKNIPGIIGFLDVEGEGQNALPRPMREAEVDRILGRMAGEEDEVKHDITFVLGETIKVIDGAFNGFTGTVEEIFDEKKKLNVMVKIFGRSTPVELNYVQVEKME